MVWYAKYMAPQMRKPTTGLWGYYGWRFLIRLNTQLEQATFEKLQVMGSDDVLELGFGPGVGISYALDKTVRSGTGKMFGVDHSVRACNSVNKSFMRDIKNGKLRIFNADVAKMPINDDLIDKVFHMNCHYFWLDKKAAAIEIKRVMKPGGLMVAGINEKNLKIGVENGFLPNCQWQTETYTDALKDAGFTDIRKETAFIEACGTDFTFISAVKPIA